jgi:hypothetical protein
MHQYQAVYVNLNCGKHGLKTYLILVIFATQYVYKKKSYVAKLALPEDAKNDMEYFANFLRD